jgi:GTPase
LAALATVEGELNAYSPAFVNLGRIVAANKIDLPHAEGLARLSALCASRKIPVLPVSALTGEGIPALVGEIATMLRASQGTLHDLAENVAPR